MSPRPLRAPAALAAASLSAVLAALPAQAASSASATAGVLRITLIDLAPGDGIDASLDFHGLGASSGAQADGLSSADYGGSFDAATAAAIASALGQGSGSTGPDGFAGAASAAGGPGFGAWTSADGQGVIYGSFVVGAWTGIVFELDYGGQATTTVGRIDADGEAALAQVTLGLNVASGDGTENHSTTRSIYAAELWTGDGYTGQALAMGGTMRLSYANLSADTASGSLYANAYAYAASALPPVPEPASVALMLAGLAGVGAAARRRAG